MSVIQQIQEKYAKLMAIIIALALIIFVVMLAFENGGSLFRGNNSSTIGKVNGKRINFNEFQQKVDQQEKYMESQGYGSGAALKQQAIDAAWNQEVNLLLLTSEFDKLGLTIGKKELGDILYGAGAPADLKRQFTDSTGFFNAQQAKMRIDQMLKGSPEERAQVSGYISGLETSRLNEKYNSLLVNSINFPKWMIEKQNADNSQLSKISFVREVYSSIPDSAIKINDKEIEEYISKHKKDFKQEENRSIAYVAFSALPTVADSADARSKLLAVKPGLDSAKDVQQFLESQGVQTYYNSYINGSTIQVPVKDSILKIPVGNIYGPYVDGNNYSLAKLVDTRIQPDTVKVRHILIATSQQDPKSGQMVPVRDTAVAYKLADSIRNAIKNGANFDTLCIKYSEDPGKNDQNTGQYNGGIYDNVSSGQMVPAFNEFIFGSPVGSKEIVKTEYGYHYIEILSQKGSSKAYKIAYLSVPVTASVETDNNANNEATQFAGNSRDQKSFDANAEKLKAKGIFKMIEPNIAPNAYQLQGLTGVSRPFIKNIYEAKLGEVLQPERVGDHYVVAIVTEINEKGTQGTAKARLMAEPLLRNHKKAEQIIRKIGTVTTLEAAAAALGGKPVETVDSIRLVNTPVSAISAEPKVVGAAFNAANKGKPSQPIEGTSGVYLVRVENITATAVVDANVAEQRKTKYEQAKTRGVYPAQVLMEAADIKDNRSKIY